MNKKFITDVVIISDVTSCLYDFYYACSSRDLRSVFNVGFLKSQSKHSLFGAINFQCHFMTNILHLFKTSIIKRIVTIINEMFNNHTSRIFVFYMTPVISKSWFAFYIRPNTLFITFFAVS